MTHRHAKHYPMQFEQAPQAIVCNRLDTVPSQALDQRFAMTSDMTSDMAFELRSDLEEGE